MLDQPDIIKIEQKELKVEGFTTEITGMYEKWMQGQLLESIRENKGQLAEDYLPLLQKHYFDLKNSQLDFGSSRFIEFLQVTANFVYLLWLCLSKHQQVDLPVVSKWVHDNPEDAICLWERLSSTKKKAMRM